MRGGLAAAVFSGYGGVHGRVRVGSLSAENAVDVQACSAEYVLVGAVANIGVGILGGCDSCECAVIIVL